MTRPRYQARRTWIGWALAGALGLVGDSVDAQEGGRRDGRISPTSVPEAGRYWHWFALADVGDSLRFNNPYRLSNQLGDTGESLSLTSAYSSIGAGVAVGDPNGWQHGLALQWSQALSGLPQHVVTPSYVLLESRWRPWLVYARAGLPVVLNPDANMGLEAGIGATWLLLAGVGLHGELVGDLFYGAATWNVGRTTIPMLSLQVGVSVDYEVLP